MNPIVIYYSRTGTTKAVAKEISRQLNCDTQVIVPAKRYSRFFLKCLFRAYKEKRDGVWPLLKSKLNLSLYDTIILGYPVWCGSAPRILHSFLKAQKIQGRTIIPFCTYRGDAGTGNDDLMNAFPDNVWKGGMAVRSRNANNCSEEVARFILKNGLTGGEEKPERKQAPGKPNK
ncbi:MAG: hypothetical protein J5758_05395 [Abditibacteriota bacterium]|nr:hypothetical protein [Abditibacteriota bacterium]